MTWTVQYFVGNKSVLISRGLQFQPTFTVGEAVELDNKEYKVEKVEPSDDPTLRLIVVYIEPK
jgi:hypothetical protein